MRKGRVANKWSEYICRICKETFSFYKNTTNPRLYCSRSCSSKDGNFAGGERHAGWKGGKVNYSGLHKWVSRHFGKAIVCFFCESTDDIQWANRSGMYLRDANDWLQLCRKCHAKYDRAQNRRTYYNPKDKQVYLKVVSSKAGNAP